jgi:hypothetical protein
MPAPGTGSAPDNPASDVLTDNQGPHEDDMQPIPPVDPSQVDPNTINEPAVPTEEPTEEPGNVPDSSEDEDNDDFDGFEGLEETDHGVGPANEDAANQFDAAQSELDANAPLSGQPGEIADQDVFDRAKEAGTIGEITDEAHATSGVSDPTTTMSSDEEDEEDPEVGGVMPFKQAPAPATDDDFDE